MRDLARLVVVVPEALVALVVVDLIPRAAALEAATSTAETTEDHAAL